MASKQAKPKQRQPAPAPVPKATPAPKPPPPAKPKRTPASGPAVRVRMYRSGLGDCFLVTFDPDGKAVHMLIDCGTLGAKSTGVSLDDVLADVQTTTGGHLHLLIATHEHKDHVSGFNSCREEFEKMQVDRVWLAWTENPKDPNAQKIARYKNDLGAALDGAARALKATPGVDKASVELGKAVESILEFAGTPFALKSDGLASTIDAAMDFIRTGFGKEAEYKTPGGAALEHEWLPGFRFYILGPPTSQSRLAELGEHESEHLYHITAGLRAAAGGRLAAHPETESEMPFDKPKRLPEDHPLVKASVDIYRRPEDSWRRIDSDWLQASADLALQLDSMTNNTSLAMAIERISDGRVLLFPADAQQGNWLSWHDPGLKWTYKQGGQVREKTAKDILSQVVFYKTGHHGSHNATARGEGLELMRREDELVAFIPVDREVALGRNPKDSWQMPALALYGRLLEKCGGRVVRSDLGWADEAKNAKNPPVESEFKALPATAPWAKWKEAQRQAEGDKRVVITPLYIDYFLR